MQESFHRSSVKAKENDEKQNSTQVRIPGYAHHIFKEEILRQKNIQKNKSDKSAEATAAKEAERILAHLDDVCSLEETVAQLTADATNKVVSLQSINEIKMLSSLGREGIDYSVEKTWSWLTQTLQMCEVHVQNASNYHQFQLCLEETQQYIDSNRHMESVVKMLSTCKTIVGQNILGKDDIEDHLNYLMNLWRRVDRVQHLAHKVVPLRKRVFPLKEPCSGLWLGSHYTWLEKGCELYLNEVLQIVDNSNRLTWRVRVQRTGQEVLVPSVGCLIPGPDQDAINLADRLCDDMCELWYASSCEIWSNVYQAFINWIRITINNGVMMSPTVRKQMIELLRHFDEVFARKMLPPKDEWFVKIGVVLDNLTKQNNSNDSLTSLAKHSLTEAQIIEIRETLKIVKILFREYAQLKRKIRQQRNEMKNKQQTPSGRTRFPSDSSTASTLLPNNKKQLPNSPETRRFSDPFLDKPVEPKPTNVSLLYWSVPDYGARVHVTVELNHNGELYVNVPVSGSGSGSADVNSKLFTSIKEIKLESSSSTMNSRSMFVTQIELSPTLQTAPTPPSAPPTSQPTVTPRRPIVVQTSSFVSSESSESSSTPSKPPSDSIGTQTLTTFLSETQTQTIPIETVVTKSSFIDKSSTFIETKPNDNIITEKPRPEVIFCTSKYVTDDFLLPLPSQPLPPSTTEQFEPPPSSIQFDQETTDDFFTLMSESQTVMSSSSVITVHTSYAAPPPLYTIPMEEMIDEETQFESDPYDFNNSTKNISINKSMTDASVQAVTELELTTTYKVVNNILEAYDITSAYSVN